MLVRAVKPFDKHSVGHVFDATPTRASELMRSGLAVAHKMQSAPSNNAAPAVQNKGADMGKAPADGEAPQSSASRAAQASQPPTASPSEPGATRPTLRLRKSRAKRSA